MPTSPTPQQARLVAGTAGVLLDDMADHLRALAEVALQALAHRGGVAQVRLEDQPERLALAGDEVEERADRGLDPLLVVRGGGERVAAPGDHVVHVQIEQGQVELLLAGEVLVEHRLADPGPLGDLVHRGRVVAVLHEHFLRRAEQLAAAGRPGQPGAPGLGVRGSGHVVSLGKLLASVVILRVGNSGSAIIVLVEFDRASLLEGVGGVRLHGNGLGPLLALLACLPVLFGGFGGIDLRLGREVRRVGTALACRTALFGGVGLGRLDRDLLGGVGGRLPCSSPPCAIMSDIPCRHPGFGTFPVLVRLPQTSGIAQRTTRGAWRRERRGGGVAWRGPSWR